jgi:hypothetical protein
VRFAAQAMIGTDGAHARSQDRDRAHLLKTFPVKPLPTSGATDALVALNR